MWIYAFRIPLMVLLSDYCSNLNVVDNILDFCLCSIFLLPGLL